MSLKLLIETLHGRPGSRVPVWLMRQAGRYLPEYQCLRAEAADFLQFCYTPALTVEAALQPLRRFRLDAAIVFSDILVIPDALGRRVRFIEGEGPQLTPLRDAGDVATLTLDRLQEHLAPLARSLELLKPQLPAGVALIGFAGAPWTLAHYLIEGRSGSDGAAVRRWAYQAPELFQRLIDLLTLAVVQTLRLQIDSGAEAVQLFDSWAGGLAEPLTRRWVILPTRRIVSLLHQSHADIPIVGFPRGAGVLYEDFVRETGIDAVSLDSALPAAWAAERLQTLRPVQGSLDNHLLAAGGEALVAETRRLLAAFSKGGHVFNLGHGVLPETPVEHVVRLVDEVRAWPRA